MLLTATFSYNFVTNIYVHNIYKIVINMKLRDYDIIILIILTIVNIKNLT